MYIESATNEKVRIWSKLKTKKGRTEQRKFIVEGSRLIKELLTSSLEIESLLWDAGTDELPESFLRAVREKNARFYELSPQAFTAVSDTVTPQGLLAVAKLPAGELQYPNRVLVLDGLQDPGNVGTLLRSADGFDVSEVICHRGTVDPFAPKVVRASMGGLFRIGAHSADAQVYIRRWREAWPDGQALYTSAGAEFSCNNANFQLPALLVVGNEGVGVSEELASLCQRGVRIPMAGKTESLNAAMAGSILMYEMYRQRIKR